MDDDDKVAEDVQNKSIIEQGEAVAERIEKANAVADEILARQEKLAIQNMLGGRSKAGQTPEVPKEENDKEYSDRINQEVRSGKYNG